MDISSEARVIKDFTQILGLPNQTDGTLFIYKKPKDIKDQKLALKPDGIYYSDGVTFILDAKSPRSPFCGQLKDYMMLEKNPNYIGFEYNSLSEDFRCYVNGVFQEEEKQLKDYQYYLQKYFRNIQITREDIVDKCAKELASLFRDSGINKQNNVPFIGAVFLCLKFKVDIINNTTNGILSLIKNGLKEVISDHPTNRLEKKNYLINSILTDSTLKKADPTVLLNIISEISTIYQFINVREKTGHDTMNKFLKVFRKWNSVDAQEKGQVFTPDHIAQLMYKLIDCNKDDTILDPTCGSGTFLTNAMANMLSETNDEDEQKEIKENRVIGIEIEEFNAALAGINMMLHGDGASNITCASCFKKLPQYDGGYNKVLMNPPFSQKTQELKFVLETLNHEKEGGLLATILPNKCLIGSSKKVRKLRKQILNKHTLLKIIRLPRQLFYPTNVTTSIAVFKAHTKHNPNNLVENYKFMDDGFVLIKHQGRIDRNNHLKTKEFWKQKPVLTKNEFDTNWLIREEFDYSTLSSTDFYETVLEFGKFLFDFSNVNIDPAFDHLNKLFNFNNAKANLFSKINSEEWQYHDICKIFNVKKCSKGCKKYELIDGKIPYVARKGSGNNGVTEYCGNIEKIYPKNTITIHHEWSDFYVPFYQPFDYVTDGMIYYISSQKMSLFSGLFITTILRKIEAELKADRHCGLKSIKIKLPSIKNGNEWVPNWQFMEDYIKNKKG